MFEKRRKEIEARRAAIRALLKDATDDDLEKLERELDELDSEEATLARKEAAADRLNRGGTPGEPIPGAPNPITGRGGAAPENPGDGLPSGVDSRAAHLADLQGIRPEEAASRADRFAQEHRMSITTDALRRSLTLSGGNIAQPTRVSGINPAQNEVSGIIDMVYTVDANGMGNENQNKMLRRRFPKGSSFEKVTAGAVAAAVEWLNNYPREIFNFASSEELFRECVAALA